MLDSLATAPEADRLFSAAHFRNRDARAALNWIRRFPFGVLVTSVGDGMLATSLPFIANMRDGAITLTSHIAARNPHSAKLAGGGEALVVFNSPSAYVSPRWYSQPANVPTWNYVGVQARGPLTVLPSQAQRRQVLEATIDTFEADADSPWRLSDAPADLVERLLPGIVAFETGPCRIECIEKLGQNKLSADFTGVIQGLRAGGHETQRAVARLMGELRPEDAPPKP